MAVSSTRATGLLAALAAALAVLAYVNSLQGPFTFDDQHEVVENRAIETLSRPGVIVRANPTRPLVNLSYAIDYALWGGRDVFGFHLTNVALHVVNVVLLFALVRRLVATDACRNMNVSEIEAADVTAFVSAGLFAVHPLMTEAVSYVSSRSDLLSTSLFLSAFYCFRSAFEGRRGWLVGGTICFFLALGSKETAAMFPFVLLASDVLLGSRSSWRSRIWRVHVPLLSVVLLAGGIRVWRYVTLEQSGVGALFTWPHVAMQAHVVVRYVALLIVPLSQTIIPAVTPISSIRDPRLAVGVVSLVGLAVLALRVRERAPLATFGLVWFALALVPTSVLSLPERIVQPMAEHRVYLASCGFFMASAALASWLTGADAGLTRARSRWLAGGVAVVLSVFLALTVARNRVWADPVRLWEDAASKAPEVFAAQAGLGYVQWVAGNCDAAETAYERAMNLRPSEPEPYIVMADCLLGHRRLFDAYTLLRLGVVRAPQDIQIRLMLAPLEERRFGGSAEALRLCREALNLKPDSVAAQACIQRNIDK